MNKGPKVSVIVPTYKRPKYLKRAIDSVLNQTYKNIELIVVDDNNDGDRSRLETQNLMAQFHDERINYIKHKVNKNGAAARNTGIKYSTGSYIAFLDDDDEFFPERIELLVEKMESIDKTWGVCYTGYIKYMKNNKVIKGKEKIEGDAYLQALMRNIFIGAGSNLFVRKEIVEEINGFNESFTRNQDIEFLLRILKNYKITYIDKELLIVHYEIRDRTLSYNDLKEVDKLFIQTFKDQIDNLGAEEKKQFFQMMAINDFRYALSSKRPLRVLKSIFKSQLELNVIVRYFLYLLKRYITKTSYGFKI
ncbi:glycosyltransferase family 2 protein [Priestia megaterium]|uniref:glycosyltransferase family 2 protein n=1 Tax=Priestia megaterium TaxID=1404 RepID=UPI0028669CD0|nr:glycosyltransferase family 2 protein [Priestia megaterium]MDR7204824.1 glycosyltransferase involved in cell wall biosynthesis [Priestia megaterium]